MLPVMVLAWVVLLSSVLLAHAEIYKWVDQAGSIHFSDTLAGVPAEYRDRIEEKVSRAAAPRVAPEVQRTALERPPAPRPPASLSYSVPVRRDGNAMLVEAVVGGSVSTRLLVDTGAEFTALSTATARRL